MDPSSFLVIFSPSQLNDLALWKSQKSQDDPSYYWYQLQWWGGSETTDRNKTQEPCYFLWVSKACDFTLLVHLQGIWNLLNRKQPSRFLCPSLIASPGAFPAEDAMSQKSSSGPKWCSVLTTLLCSSCEHSLEPSWLKDGLTEMSGIF